MGPMRRMRLMRVSHRSHVSHKSYPFATSSASHVTHMLIDPATLLAPKLITDPLITDYLRTSHEPDRVRDQEQPHRDSSRPNSPRDLLAGRREAFGGDGCGYGSHRTQVHDPHDEENHRQAGTAVTAVKTEVQAASPSCVGICRQRTPVPRPSSTAREVMRLPRCELKQSRDHDNDARCDWNGPC